MIKMNKLIIDKENNVEIKDNVLDLIINVPKLTLNIKGKVLINEIAIKDNESLELTINIEPNSSLIYNRFMIHQTINNTFILNQEHHSEAIFNYSIIAKDKCNLTFNGNLFGNNNKTDIKIKAITEDKGCCKIISTADAKSKIEDNNLIESIKILTLNEEENICIPNLLVASNEVEVNHACTISSIDSKYLFYLNSKGISTEKAISLIKKGYLLSNLNINDEIASSIKELIGGE